MTEEQRQKHLAAIKQFRLIDDTFMNVFFKDNIPATELVLHIILERDDLVVVSVTTQPFFKNLLGRDVYLDIVARDADGRRINIEVQRDRRGAVPKRARYHSSILDASSLGENEPFDNLPETYVIFITENDVLGGDLPIYHIERTIKETNTSFNDSAHIIYVNGEKRTGDSPLSLLMHDFFCTDPAEMNFEELAEKSEYFKTNDKEVSDMCEIMEKLIAEREKEQSIEIALKLLALEKLSYEEIALSAGLPLAEVVALAGEKTA